MTTGLYPAGISPAGAPPVQTGYSVKPQQPVAIRYEGRDKDFPVDSAGNYEGLTPVEQGFGLAISVQQGELKSSPTVGNTLHEIEYLGNPDLAADIEDRVRRAVPIASYLADGSASITRIDHEVHANGLKVAVYFKDLTQPRQRDREKLRKTTYPR